MTHLTSHLRSRRSGFTILECVVAVTLLTISSGVLIPMISRLQGVKAEHARRLAAMIELQNLHELDSDDASRPPVLSAEFQRRYPGAVFTSRKMTSEQNANGDWFSYSIHWEADSSKRTRPVELRFFQPHVNPPAGQTGNPTAAPSQKVGDLASIRSGVAT